jgi:hypothetical protein
VRMRMHLVVIANLNEVHTSSFVCNMDNSSNIYIYYMNIVILQVIYILQDIYLHIYIFMA